MSFINYRVAAGHAVAVLKNQLAAIIVIAPVGYAGGVVHERIGTVQLGRIDPEAESAAFQFQWQDEDGTAETVVNTDEEITMCLRQDQRHLLEQFAPPVQTKFKHGGKAA